MPRSMRRFVAWLGTPTGGFWWNTVFAAANAALATNDSGLPSWVSLAGAVTCGLFAVRCAVQEQAARPAHLHFKTVNSLPLTDSAEAGEGR